MGIPATLSSVPAVTPYIQYIATNGQTVFPYPFVITQDSDLVVVVNGVTSPTDSGYTLSGVGNSTGGNVTFTLGQTAGAIITLFRNIAIQRITQIGQNSGFSSTAFNAEYNNIYLILQQLQESIALSLQIPNTNSPAPTTTLLPANYANKYLAFDANGNPTPATLTASGALTQALIAGLLFTQTTAEATAGVVPTNFAYVEGDIRRYGASTGAGNNSVAITAALSVSAAGGSAAFIPGGTWKTTAAIVVPAASSMYGAGTASILNPSNGVDGLQFTAADAGIVARSRFFRDFQIQGTLSGSANAAHGLFISASVISHCEFQNLSILNFQYGIYSQGLYYSTISSCFIQNCYQGIYFNNQSINVFLLDNTIQLTSGGTLITASGSSQGISCTGAPEIEGLHIQGGSIYGFNYGINLGLVFECQINAVDIAFSTICPVFFSSTIGGLTIRDCWLELASTASGTWNTAGTGTGNLTGIFISAITPSTITKVHIHGNEILSDVTIGGSTAIYLGNSNNGISVTDNHMLGFDIGIGGGNTLNNIGGSLAGATIKGNTINATTSGILLNNGCTELELGPNYIVSGAQVAFTSTAPTSMVYQQPNVPMKGIAAFSAGTTVAVAFTNAMPFSTYRVALSGNAAGYCWVTLKATTGFTINCSASNSNAVEWAISA